MRGVAIHVVVYAVVNAFLVGLWLVLGGTTAELQDMSADPIQALRDGFWPGIVAASWALALALHIGIWLCLLPLGGTRRRRRASKAHHGEARHGGRHELPSPLPPDMPMPPARSGHPLGREAARAAIGLVDSLGKRVAARTQDRPSAPRRRRAVSGWR